MNFADTLGAISNAQNEPYTNEAKKGQFAELIGKLSKPSGQQTFGEAPSQFGITDAHLHPANENGVRHFNDEGMKYLGGIVPDNTGLITSLRGASSSINPMSGGTDAAGGAISPQQAASAYKAMGGDTGADNGSIIGALASFFI